MSAAFTAPTSSRFLYDIGSVFCHDYVMIHLVWLAVLPAFEWVILAFYGVNL